MKSEGSGNVSDWKFESRTPAQSRKGLYTKTTRRTLQVNVVLNLVIFFTNFIVYIVPYARNFLSGFLPNIT